MGHPAFLPPDHPLLRDKKSFNGKEDQRSAPTPLSGTEYWKSCMDSIMFLKRAKRGSIETVRVHGVTNRKIDMLSNS